MSVDFNIGIQNSFILNINRLSQRLGYSVIDFYDPIDELPIQNTPLI